MSLEDKVNEETLASAVKAMENLVDEAVQVYEIDKEKTNVIGDLYNSLKIITTYLSFTVDLSPKIIDLPENVRLILTPDLNLLIIRQNFKSEVKRFDQLTLDETSNVLKFAIPAIISMARDDREIKHKKISFLREGAMKLKRLPSSSADEIIITNTTPELKEEVKE